MSQGDVMKQTESLFHLGDQGRRGHFVTGQSIAEMRAMADEALLNGGRGKHDDPAYYSRNLAILLKQALAEIEGYQASPLWESQSTTPWEQGTGTSDEHERIGG